MSDETNEPKNPTYKIDPDSQLKKPKYNVKLTTGAKKIVDEEEAKVLINMIVHEFEKHPHLNIFKFEKVGLIVLKKGTNLLILTETEKNNSSKPT